MHNVLFRRRRMELCKRCKSRDGAVTPPLLLLHAASAAACCCMLLHAASAAACCCFGGGDGRDALCAPLCVAQFQSHQSQRIGLSLQFVVDIGLYCLLHPPKPLNESSQCPASPHDSLCWCRPRSSSRRRVAESRRKRIIIKDCESANPGLGPAALAIPRVSTDHRPSSLQLRSRRFLELSNCGFSLQSIAFLRHHVAR